MTGRRKILTLSSEGGVIVPQALASARRETGRRIRTYTAWTVIKASKKASTGGGGQCWLLGGMSGRAYADNAAALHQHLVENYPELMVYWVIDRDSLDVGKASQIGPVLYREDLEAYIYGLRARVHIISHGLADVPTCGSSLSNNALKVRLGHGLTALKKTKSSPWRRVEAKNQRFDLVPVSSEFEKRHKMEWGIDPGNLVVTGLPRFDALVHQSARHQALQAEVDAPARILYMPTWRDWLPRGEKAFRRTEFYRHLRAFLLHPDLGAMLDRYNVMLDVHVHVIMRQHAPTIARELASPSRVQVLPPGTDLQDALARSRLLITDYSSVAWDFLYLDRPVLFYQFDVEEFNRHRGSYIELGELFGPIAHGPEQAVDLVKGFLENSFDPGPYRPRMDEWQRRAFCYRDTKNCERVVRAILERLDRR